MDAVKTSIKLADLMAYKGEMPVEVVNGTLRKMPQMAGFVLNVAAIFQLPDTSAGK